MNVIDKILNEWSFRCHDGIVDMNNPKKVSILKEVLIEEGIDDDIVDAVLNLPKDNQASEEKKQKALAILKGTSSDEKEEIDEMVDIEDKLMKKGLPEKESLFITRIFTRAKKQQQLIDYFKKQHEFKTSFKSVFENTKELDPDIIKRVYNYMASLQGNKAIGREEYFLVAFYDNVKKRVQEGDITINENDKYEVKGPGSMISPLSRGGYTKDIKNSLHNFIEKITGLPNNKNIGELKEEIDKSKRSWPFKIQGIYNLIEKNDEKNIKNFKDELKKLLNNLYKGINVNVDNIVNSNKFDPEILSKEISDFLIKDLKTKENYLFVDNEGKIKIVDNKDLINSINNTISIVKFPDLSPRYSFGEKSIFEKYKEKEEKTQEKEKEKEEKTQQQKKEKELKPLLDILKNYKGKKEFKKFKDNQIGIYIVPSQSLTNNDYSHKALSDELIKNNIVGASSISIGNKSYYILNNRNITLDDLNKAK
jgi:hypothetical protein